MCYYSRAIELTGAMRPWSTEQKEVKRHEGRYPSQVRTDYDPLCLWQRFHNRFHKKDIKVEICSKCHPFYTGKQKLVDTGGRVDRFNKRFGLK